MRGDTAAGIRHTCQHWIGGRIPPQDHRITFRSYCNINNPNFNRFPQITNSADLACTWDLPLCVHLTGKPGRLRTMRFLHTRDSPSVDVNKEQATAAAPLCHVPSWRSQGRLYLINRWFTAFVFFSHLPLQYDSSTGSHKCYKHNSLTYVKLGYNNTLFSLHVIISALFIAVLENVADKYWNQDKTVANVANIMADVRLKMYLNTRRVVNPT